MRFEELGLRPKTVDALKKMQYEEPTEVQQKVIPLILNGNNVIVRSKTGTGKTAAFGIGVIERLANGSAIKALVLTPTRELSVQVSKELMSIASNYPLKISVVYGGVSINPQIDELRKGVDVLIATPGRLIDHAERNTVDLSRFNVIVLDEADRMLDMGFKDQMDYLMSRIPQSRTVILLSATLDDSIMRIASNYMGKPEIVEVGEKDKPEEIKEEHVEVARNEKITKLGEILKAHSQGKVLIFTSTKIFADRLSERLARMGFRSDRIQGDMSQAARENVLHKFRQGQLRVLVATDIAARGLHIDDVELIVNYDRAQDADTHLHRIGRTGRMGASGKAITFVEKSETPEERFSDDHPDFAWMRHGLHPTGVSHGRRPTDRDESKGRGERKGAPLRGGWKSKKNWQR